MDYCLGNYIKTTCVVAEWGIASGRFVVLIKTYHSAVHTLLCALYRVHNSI